MSTTSEGGLPKNHDTDGVGRPIYEDVPDSEVTHAQTVTEQPEDHRDTILLYALHLIAAWGKI